MAMMPDSRGALPTIKKGKISDMVKEWTSKTEHPFISFEYFPPKTPEGVEKLHKTFTAMALRPGERVRIRETNAGSGREQRPLIRVW